MRRHEVTTLRAITRLKEDNSARPTRASEQALVSAPERDLRWERFTILCNSQKQTSRLDIHYSACLKHSDSPIDQNTLWFQLLFTLQHHGNSRFKQLAPQVQIPTRSVHHVSSSCCTLRIHALPLAEQSLGESVTAISPSTLQRLGSSECLEALLPMECRDLVMSRASSESRIFPLTASAVTRATTSLHKSPPFIVVRLVRELTSVRVHAARFLPPTRPISCSIRGRLTPFGLAPTYFTLTSFWINCELNLCMWLWISFHDRVFVNGSAPLSTPATLLKSKSPFAAFSWIHK